MGFFGTLFGGEAEKEAADKNRALYAQYSATGQRNLANGLNNSLSSLQTGFGNANTTLGQNRDIWGNYGTAANGALDAGMVGATGALGAAKASYDPLAALGAKYGQGTSLYLDSLGVNGAGGNANAVSAFQAGPGYGFAMDQGMDALNRRRAAGGMLNSGNADIDALKFGQGLANTEYGGWQSKLQGLISPEMQAKLAAAQGRAGIDQAEAALYQTNAGNRVGVAGNVATGTAGVNTAIAGNQSGLGAGQAGLYTQNASDLTNLAGSVTSGNAGANNYEAAGQAAGAKNLLGLGTSLLGLGLGGGFGGLGKAATGATNLFGGNGPTGYGGGTGFKWPWS